MFAPYIMGDTLFLIVSGAGNGGCEIAAFIQTWVVHFDHFASSDLAASVSRWRRGFVMRYQLPPNIRNVSDEEVLEDMRRVARERIGGRI